MLVALAAAFAWSANRRWQLLKVGRPREPPRPPRRAPQGHVRVRLRPEEDELLPARRAGSQAHLRRLHRAAPPHAHALGPRLRSRVQPVGPRRRARAPARRRRCRSATSTSSSRTSPPRSSSSARSSSSTTASSSRGADDALGRGPPHPRDHPHDDDRRHGLRRRVARALARATRDMPCGAGDAALCAPRPARSTAHFGGRAGRTRRRRLVASARRPPARSSPCCSRTPARRTSSSSRTSASGRTRRWCSSS